MRHLLPIAALLVAAAPAQTPCHDLSDLVHVGQDAVNQLLMQGLQLRVDQGGQTVFSQSYGSHTSTTTMPLASATKTMSAAVLMSLVDQGLLQLDDPVGMYLPEYAAPSPLSQITLRHCFAHTSGLPVLHQAATNDPSITLRQAATNISNLPLLFTPGTKFQYGNVSMHIAGAVCEVVTGLSWEDLFNQQIGTPLGMTSTDYFYFAVSNNPRIADGAQSNTDDYAKFVEMLRNGGTFNGSQILSQAAVDEMMTDQNSQLPIVATAHPANKPTGIGLWIEKQDSQGDTTLVSMPGAFGFYAWLDLAHDTTGVWLGSSFYVQAYPFIEQCWGITDRCLAPIGITCSGSYSPACTANPIRLNGSTWARDGQSDFGLRISNASASALGGISLAFGPPTPVGLPFLDLLVYLPPGAPQSFGTVPIDASGEGLMPLSLPTGLIGVTCTLQSFLLNTGGCGTSNIAASRPLELVIQAP